MPNNKTPKTVDIVDWFDIHDINHLKAWAHLSDTGLWPGGFIPHNVTFNKTWQIEIACKMSDAWTSYIIG